MEIFKEPLKFGHYRIFAKVAEGGMAEVFLSTSTKKEFENEFIAIKKLHANLNQNKPFVNLLIHEAKIGVLLNHPSIASVYDLGSHKQEFFLAMEYVHGKSLDRIIERIDAGQAAPLGLELATYITLETLRALAFAHQLKDVKGRDLNIIHRDVSPGNLLVEYKGNIKLSDFGIATAESRLQVEFSSSAMGKMKYMPPEQAVNDPVVQASDLYSLAIVYFQLLTGRLPYESETPSQLYREIVDGRIDSISSDYPLTKELEAILMKALDKSAKKRYATAGEFFEVIRQYFLKSENTDFNSRTVRAYYRKKLAEYLRRYFEDEIVSELELIQQALHYHDDNQGLKETAPQTPPADIEIDGFSEATQIHQDHSEEATRHYPLTLKERESLIKGLPPKQVLEPLNFNTESLEEGFELATLPETDFDWTKQKSEIKNVESKIERVSLSRDQKEQLNQVKPAVQIISEQDLVDFEDSALTHGDKTIMLSLESEMGPDYENAQTAEQPVPKEILNSPLEKVEYPESEDLDQNDPLETPTKQSDPDDPNLSAPKSVSSYSDRLRTLLPLSSFFKKRSIPLKSIFIKFSQSVFVLAAFYFVFVALNQFFDFSSYFRPQKALLPTHQVALVFLGDADLRSQRNFQNLISERLPEIQGFFQREYARYKTSKSENKALLHFIPQLPELVPSRVSENLLKTNFENALSTLAESGFRHRPAAAATIFVYLRDQEPTQFYWIPGDDLKSRQHKKSGIAFHRVNDETLFPLLLEIARQIAFVHGARNKQDRQSQLPQIPFGVADPERNPIFPQDKAELMGRDILTSLYAKEPAKSFDQVLIGPETAYELGWISRKRKEQMTSPAVSNSSAQAD